MVDSIVLESEHETFKQILHKLNDYRNAIIIVICWLIASEVSSSENRVDVTIRQVIRFFLYPINLLLFNTDFSNAGFPPIYIILVPFVCVMAIGFLYLISTED